MKIHAILIALAVAGIVAVNAQTPSPSPAPHAKPEAKTAVNPDEAIAKVGDVAIKRRELDISVQGFLMQMQQQGQFVPPQYRPQIEHDVLDQLIGRELVLQANRATPPAGVDAKVKEELDRARKMTGGEEAFQKGLQEAGVSVKEFESRARENIIVMETLRHLVEQKTQIATNEAKEFYDANLQRFRQPESVRASHILLRLPSDANEETKKLKHTQISAARSLILNGDKFEDVARKVSECPSAQRGGDLGFFPRGMMAPEFEKAAFESPTNKVSEVFSTEFGYHILVVREHKPAEQLAFEKVKPNIEQFLRSRKGAEVAREYVKGLRDKAKVEVFLPPLPAPVPAAAPAPTK